MLSVGILARCPLFTVSVLAFTSANSQTEARRSVCSFLACLLYLGINVADLDYLYEQVTVLIATLSGGHSLLRWRDASRRVCRQCIWQKLRVRRRGDDSLIYKA